VSIIQASFFYKNNIPGGIGITFGPPGFTSADLEVMFNGEVSKKFMRDSDEHLGSNIVGFMISQLDSIGEAKQRGDPITSRTAVMAALNIMWLSSRGFIPNDEFNGVQFVSHVVMKPNHTKPS
jgi:hypothetical protein